MLFDEQKWNNYQTIFSRDDPRYILSEQLGFAYYKINFEKYFESSSNLHGAEKKKATWLRDWNSVTYRSGDFWNVYGEILSGFFLKEKFNMHASWVPEKPRQRQSTPDLEGTFEKKIFFEIQTLANAEGTHPEERCGVMPTFARYVTTNIKSKIKQLSEEFPNILIFVFKPTPQFYYPQLRYLKDEIIRAIVGEFQYKWKIDMKTGRSITKPNAIQDFNYTKSQDAKITSLFNDVDASRLVSGAFFIQEDLHCKQTSIYSIFVNNPNCINKIPDAFYKKIQIFSHILDVIHEYNDHYELGWINCPSDVYKKFLLAKR